MTSAGDAGGRTGPLARVTAWRAARRDRRALDFARSDRPEQSPTESARARETNGPARPHRRSAAMIGAGVASVVVIVLLFLGPGSFAVWSSQRSQTHQLDAKISALDEANASLAEQAKQLHDPQAIRELARRNYGMVPKGSKSYAILPSPSPDTALRGTWPFVELTDPPASPPSESRSAPTTTP